VSATCTYYVGDALTVMRSLPAGSVDLLLTSPPFLALRSYLPPGHPDKAKEMGSEATPGEFIDALLDVVEEADRALAEHGSLSIELGDTYAGSGGAGGDYAENGLREGQQRFDGSASKAFGLGAAPRPPRERWRSSGPDPRYKNRGEQVQGTGAGGDWPLDKSLCLVPELLRFALAYGLNPLTGRQTPRWRVRNVVRWCRPNPPVGALADKFRPATSEMVVACKSRSRYFDQDAVRGDPGEVKDQRIRTTNGPKNRADRAEVLTAEYTSRVPSHPNGPPPHDWWLPNAEEVALWDEWQDQFEEQAWVIPPRGYRGSHYATWPPALCVRPILSMCPERVCTECGEPSRRIAETTNAIGSAVGRRSWRHDTEGKHSGEITASISSAPTAARRTLGWTDCGHNAYRPGVVLDPFAGTGTTGLVATGHGRSAVLIDLDARNLHLARERIGMFLIEGVMEASA
jgi:hypothetical protein